MRTVSTHRIKLRHLECFLEVARLKSVVKAAEALAVTQPAVSKTLKELDDILGVRVLDRSRAGVGLTAEGERFRRYAETALAAVREGVAEVSQAGGGDPVVPLSVGVLPSVAARMLPRAIEQLTRARTDARIRLVTGPNAYLAEQLRIGALDLVVGRLAGADQMAGLTFEHLYSERVVFAVRPGHPLLAHRALSPQVLRDWPLLLPSDGAIIKHDVQRYLLAQGVDGVHAVVETVSAAFGRAFVQDTDAVWGISHGVVARDLEDGLLEILPLDTSDTLGPVGLTWRASETLSPVGAALAAVLREMARDRDPITS